MVARRVGWIGVEALRFASRFTDALTITASRVYPDTPRQGTSCAHAEAPPSPTRERPAQPADRTLVLQIDIYRHIHIDLRLPRCPPALPVLSSSRSGQRSLAH